MVINEVESDGAADFVELFNTGPGSFDISGFVVKDNDDSRTLAVPPGTSIAANGYYVVYVDVAGGFTLGSNDSARLFLPNGLTLVDSYSWTSHAAATYGRCPDGTGPFVSTTATTGGAANACPAIPPPDDGGGGEAGDTDPPETTITSGPKAKTKKKHATFEFASSEGGSTFECSLNGASFTPCTSPFTVDGKKGKNSFAVRTRDAVGNVDSTPATFDWKVKKKKK